MRPQLPNAPLTEVACEVRFHGDLALLSAWGDVQHAVRSEFPDVFLPLAVPGMSPLLQHAKLSSSDGAESLLLALNSFAYITQRYTSYGPFRARFLELQEKFFKHTRIGAATRFGLRYTNSLPPSTSDTLEPGQLHAGLKLKLSGVDLVETPLSGQSQLIVERPIGGMTLRMALVQPPALPIAVPPEMAGAVQFSPGVRLDLDCYTEKPGGLAAISSHLDTAHRVIEDAFFSLVSESYEKYMAGDEETSS